MPNAPRHRIAASVVLTIYEGDDASDVFDALEPQAAGWWELIVISDRQRDIPPRLAEHAQFITSTDGSRERKWNLGIAAACGDVVVFLDASCIPGPRFVAAHLIPYADLTVGGAAGRVIARSADARRFNLDPPTSKHGFNTFWRKRYNWKFPQAAAAARGSNMSFRRDLLYAVGGFDERFTGPGERSVVDMALRVRDADYIIMYEPDAIARHSAALSRWRKLMGSGDRARGDFFRDSFYLLFKNRPRWFAYPKFAAILLATSLCRVHTLLRPWLWIGIPFRYRRGIAEGWKMSRSAPDTWLPHQSPKGWSVTS